MAQTSPFDELKARLAEHGYHLFLRPDRPSGWWVTIRDGQPGCKPPIEARAEARIDALRLAGRLFVSHRLTELDAMIRTAGLTPPFWGRVGQDDHLLELARFARANGLLDGLPAAR
jgi:hypothetical protein